MASYEVLNRDGVRSMAAGIHVPRGAMLHDGQLPPNLIKSLEEEGAIKELDQAEVARREAVARVSKLDDRDVVIWLNQRKVQRTEDQNADPLVLRELLVEKLIEERPKGDEGKAEKNLKEVA